MSKIMRNQLQTENYRGACRSTLSEAVATSLEFGRRIPGSMRRRKACRISYSWMRCDSGEAFASCCARLWAAAARRSAAISDERIELGGDVDLSDMSFMSKFCYKCGRGLYLECTLLKHMLLCSF